MHRETQDLEVLGQRERKKPRVLRPQRPGHLQGSLDWAGWGRSGFESQRNLTEWGTFLWSWQVRPSLALPALNDIPPNEDITVQSSREFVWFNCSLSCQNWGMGMDDVRFSPWGKKAKEKVPRNFKCEGVVGQGHRWRRVQWRRAERRKRLTLNTNETDFAGPGTYSTINWQREAMFL